MFDLIKFTEEKYAASFLEGKLFMNTLGHFWEQGFEGQRDMKEGTQRLSTPGSTPALPKEVQDVILGNVGWRRESSKYCHLLCLYRLDRYLEQVLEIDTRIAAFGPCAIHIKNADQFILRIQRAAGRLQDSYFCCGDVDYYMENSGQACSYTYDCFCKPAQLAYQHEWRLALLHHYSQLKQLAATALQQPFDTGFILDIGDIHDIAEAVPTQELIHNAKAYFRGQRIVKELKKEKELTPQVADAMFARGITVPRSALDGAYWGCERETFDALVDQLAPNQYKPYFAIG